MKRGKITHFFPQIWLTLWLVTCLFFRTSDTMDLSMALEGPTLRHILGTDPFGRGLLRTIGSAALQSSFFAGIATVLSIAIALPLGTAATQFPPTLRSLFLRSIEFLLAFPSLLFALAWAAVHGPSWHTLIFSLLIGTLPSFIRLIYVRACEIEKEEYVLASNSLGASRGRIVLRHLVPQTLSLCAVKGPFLFANALIAEATLSFLGIGAPIGSDTWGSLLALGKDYLLEAPHIAIGSGIPLMLTVLSIQSLAKRGEQNRAA